MGRWQGKADSPQKSFPVRQPECKTEVEGREVASQCPSCLPNRSLFFPGSAAIVPDVRNVVFCIRVLAIFQSALRL